MSKDWTKVDIFVAAIFIVLLVELIHTW